MTRTKEERMYMRIRNVAGLLGVVLPWLALFSAGVSATYYLSPALVGVLVPASIAFHIHRQ